MAICFVANCTIKNRKQAKTVTLHTFPRTAELIREWLICCGVPEAQLAERTAQVLADVNGNRFRVCSHHFSADLYASTSSQASHGKVGRLIAGAIPNLKLAPAAAYAPIQIAVADVVEVESAETCMEVDIAAVGTQVSTVEHMEAQTEVSFCSMVSACSQTERKCADAVCQTEVESTDAFSQWPEYEFNYSGEENKVTKDHTYHTDMISDSPPLLLSDAMQSTPLKRPLRILMDEMQGTVDTSNVTGDSWDDSFVPELVHEQVVEQVETENVEEPLLVAQQVKHSEMHANNEEEEEEEEEFDEKNDPDYLETERPDDDSFFEREDNDLEEMVSEKKYLVFRSCLIYLFSFLTCNFLVKGLKCGKPLSNLKIEETGTLVTIEAWCFDQHPHFLWKSQPMIKRFSAGNLLLASSLLFSGLTYEKVATFAGFLGLVIMGKTSFYKYQNRFLFPTLHEAWEHEKMLLDKSFAGLDIAVSGDGQCDSPGFSAKYLVYTMMEQTTSKILSVLVVQVTECTSSVAMEKHALVKSLDKLLARGLKIKILTTDRHVSIAKVMREMYMFINHQFDVWHMVKSVLKKILEAAKKKDCRELATWSHSITNHLWWCSRSCGKNLALLREMWMSVLHHTTGKHKWNGYKVFHSCGHERLTAECQRAKKWLQPETPAHDALVKIVCDKTIEKDLRGLTEFTHTGHLESFHSSVLRVRMKLVHYSIDGMVGRTQLAALKHNANTGRCQKRKQTGDSDDEEAGEPIYNIVFPKYKKEWVAKKVFEGMDYSYIYDMQVHVLSIPRFNVRSTWESLRAEHPKNIASVEAPPKAELIAKFKSRF